MRVDDMNAFIKSVCEGQQYERYIDGYSKEIEKYLKGCGYIIIEGDGIMKRIFPTDKGRELYENGGFTCSEPLKPIGFNTY